MNWLSDRKTTANRFQKYFFIRVKTNEVINTHPSKTQKAALCGAACKTLTFTMGKPG